MSLNHRANGKILVLLLTSREGESLYVTEVMKQLKNYIARHHQYWLALI